MSELTYSIHKDRNLGLLFWISAFQIIPVSQATEGVRRDRGNATYELVIPFSIPPLGYSTYQIQAATAPGMYN